MTDGHMEQASARSLTRIMELPTGWDERCDGCAVEIPKGTPAQYRLDGALFCTIRCADNHAGIPQDTSGKVRHE